MKDSASRDAESPQWWCTSRTPEWIAGTMNGPKSVWAVLHSPLPRPVTGKVPTSNGRDGPG